MGLCTSRDEGTNGHATNKARYTRNATNAPRVVDIASSASHGTSPHANEDDHNMLSFSNSFAANNPFAVPNRLRRSAAPVAQAPPAPRRRVLRAAVTAEVFPSQAMHEEMTAQPIEFPELPYETLPLEDAPPMVAQHLSELLRSAPLIVRPT